MSCDLSNKFIIVLVFFNKMEGNYMQKKLHIENQNVDVDQLIYKIGSYHYNWHNNLELFWLISGRIEMTVDGCSQVMEKGDIILINSNSGHVTFALKPNSIAMRMYISPDFFIKNSYNLDQGYFELNTLWEKNNPVFQHLRKALANLYLCTENGTKNLVKINKYLFSIADLLSEFYQKGNKKMNLQAVTQGETAMDTVVEYIKNHYAEEITLDLLAKKCNYSSSYLSKLFKSELGINFYEYLTRHRLIYAIKDLANPELKISEITFRNGFSDVKSFNNMFKKHFQQTPSAYRNQLNNDLKIVDRQFKKDLTTEEKEDITLYLKKLVSNGSVQLENPCSGCLAKEYEEKYFGLVKNIKQVMTN